MLEGKSGDYERGKYRGQSKSDAKDREQYPPRIVFLGVIYNRCHAPIFADSQIPPSTLGAARMTNLGHRLEADGK